MDFVYALVCILVPSNVTETTRQEMFVAGDVNVSLMLIMMVIFRCYFSREHIALSCKKWRGHRIRKNQQIKSTAHDGK